MRAPEIRAFADGDRPACATVLATLPQWFGIPAANKAYLDILGDLPTAVAAVDGVVVGFAAVEQHNPISAELHILAVSRELHAQGLGSALLAWAEAWCLQIGVQWFHVKTRGPSTPDPDYERTRQFYLARGFDALFESLTLWGSDDAALILVKRLELGSGEPESRMPRAD